MTESGAELPTVFTIGDRTYEVASVVKDDEKRVSPYDVPNRARTFGANVLQEDCEFIQQHQDAIPREYQGRIKLVFMGWRYPYLPLGVACLCWKSDHWYQDWIFFAYPWYGNTWLVRRIA